MSIILYHRDACVEGVIPPAPILGGIIFKGCIQTSWGGCMLGLHLEFGGLLDVYVCRGVSSIPLIYLLHLHLTVPPTASLAT